MSRTTTPCRVLLDFKRDGTWKCRCVTRGDLEDKALSMVPISIITLTLAECPVSALQYFEPGGTCDDLGVPVGESYPHVMLPMPIFSPIHFRNPIAGS